MLLMLVIVSKAHGVTWVIRITNNILKTLVTQTFFDVSSEIDPILVTCFLVIECYKVIKKTFIGPSRKLDEKAKKKKDQVKQF